MDSCICVAVALTCSPETITTLLIGYTPIQNKKLKKKSVTGHKHKMSPLEQYVLIFTVNVNPRESC